MKKLLLLIILNSLVISGCRSVIPTLEIPIDPTPTPSGPSKQVSATTLPFVERWRRSGIISGSQYPPNVIAAQERIIIADNDGRGRKVMVFDAHTGNLIWQSEYIEHLHSLSVLDHRIYVGTMRYAQAFDLETGEVLWQGAEQPWDKKGFLDVYPTEEQIHVYDFDQNHLYLLDPQTGLTLEEMEYPYIFFKQGDTYYSGCGYGYKTSCLGRASIQDDSIHWGQQFE